MAKIVVCDICGERINGMIWEFNLKAKNGYAPNREKDLCACCARKLIDAVKYIKNNKSEEEENSNEEDKKNETPCCSASSITDFDKLSFF